MTSLGCDRADALEVLNELQRVDHSVTASGHIECAECGEPRLFKSHTISGIRTEAASCAGLVCDCGAQFPGAGNIGVLFSFGLSPVAGSAGRDAEIGRGREEKSTLPFSVNELAAIASKPGGVIINQHIQHVGGDITAGDKVGGASLKAGRDLKSSVLAQKESKSAWWKPAVVGPLITVIGGGLVATYCHSVPQVGKGPVVDGPIPSSNPAVQDSHASKPSAPGTGVTTSNPPPVTNKSEQPRP